MAAGAKEEVNERMDAQGATQPKSKSGWDTRAWYLALATAVILIPLEAPEAENSLQRLIHEPLASNLMIIALSLSLFAFPPILSGFARRRTLLWAYLPFAIFVAAGFGLNELPQPPDPPDTASTTTWEDITIGVVVMLCPLITAGPVCLYRVARRRAIARQAASDAALHHAMLTRQEGVWPPPPAQMMQESPAENGE